jgi:hypothetical protein
MSLINNPLAGNAPYFSTTVYQRDNARQFYSSVGRVLPVNGLISRHVPI